jgi:hypothetical protein
MEEKEVEKLDHKIDYIERIDFLEEEIKRIWEQAAKFRDLAHSHAVLLRRAAEALNGVRAGASIQTSFYASLIAELYEAAKDE